MEYNSFTVDSDRKDGCEESFIENVDRELGNSLQWPEKYLRFLGRYQIRTGK